MNKTIPLLLIVVLFGAAGWYFFTAKPAAVHELLPPQIAPAEQPKSEPVSQSGLPQQLPEPEILPEPLPELNASDADVKQALSDIFGADALGKYLVKNAVISRFVVTLDSLNSRQVPAQINPFRPVSGDFKVTTNGDKVVMSPDNFARYDGYVEVLQKLDNDALVAMYHRYYPLFQQAWEENGGEGSFNQRLIEVLNHLLETPAVPNPVELVKPEAVYLFADPQLELLTAGQKILVRMGSDNASIVKDKLAELAQRIGKLN